MLDKLLNNALRSIQQAKELYCQQWNDGRRTEDAVDYDWITTQFNNALDGLERLKEIVEDG